MRALPILLVATGLAVLAAGCGGEDSGSGGAPTISSPRIVDSKVEVDYAVPGGGGDDVQLLLSVLQPESGLMPFTEAVAGLEEEGTATIEHEVGPGREVIVFGSAIYRDGRRLYVPEFHLTAPPDASGEDFGIVSGSPQALANCREAEVSRQKPEVRCGQP
jgi:hypothetical protein